MIIHVYLHNLLKSPMPKLKPSTQSDKTQMNEHLNVTY